MPNEDLQKYKSLYLQTAHDYVKSLKKNMDMLVNHPQNHDAMKQAHIEAHSLKSQSLLMHYNNIGNFCAAIEKTLSGALEKELNLNAEMLQIMQEGTKKMDVSLKEIEQSDTEIDLSEETNNLKKLSEL